jgi:lysophospholipid acyltransferase (LPLAT)-like uncharacterized protein
MAEPSPDAGRVKVRKPKSLLAGALRRAGETAWPWQAAGKVGATYMRAVRATSPLKYEPGNPFEIYAADAPFILTVWHGQHFMVPFLLRDGDRMRALISKSRDGDASAAYLGSFGIEPIRGSGGRDPRRQIEKGAVRGFLQLKKSLDDGITVGTIADVSNTVARRCGEGIIALARSSGRPIVGLGFATSRWLELNSWDRATVHFPFSKGACAVTAPIYVPRGASAETLEAKRIEVERSLNTAMSRAYEMVGRHRD